MVVSHRETTISSNIRAIIEQLNLNPVERRRLIDRTRENARITAVDPPTKIKIGVYGCNERNDRIITESSSKIKISVYKEQNEANDCVDAPANLNIYECKPKVAKFDTVDFTNNNSSGKVTIGVYGCKHDQDTFLFDTKIKSSGERDKISIDLCPNDEIIQTIKIDDFHKDKKPLEIVAKSKSKAELRQRIPPSEKIQEPVEVNIYDSIFW